MTFWVAGAVVVSSAINSSGQRSAASQASDAATRSSEAAVAEQARQFDRQQENQAPWQAAGANALGAMRVGTQEGGQFMRPFGMADYQADPGYQFRLSEGLKGLERSAAARGGLLSGSSLKGISRFNQDQASQEYGNAFGRYNQNQNTQFNRLASIAGLGQTANAQMGAAGQNYANYAGNAMMSAGANQGNAALAAGQANASMYGDIGKAMGRIPWGSAFSSGGSSEYDTWNNASNGPEWT